MTEVLIAHSYIGTLLFAARRLGLNVIASMEVDGFGSDIQQHNFPTIPIIRKREDWLMQAKLPLHNNWFLIGHAPCAYGSCASPNHKRGGLDNPESSFSTTVDYIRYGKSILTPMIIGESVPNSYNVASKDLNMLTHEKVNEGDPDYGITIVFDHSCHYGCSSLRKRMWYIIFRKDLFPDGLSWTRPDKAESRTAGQALAEAVPGTKDGFLYGIPSISWRCYNYLTVDAWTNVVKLGENANKSVRNHPDPSSLLNLGVLKTKANGEVMVYYESTSAQRVDPDSLANTITGSTLLVYPDGTRPLSISELLSINHMPVEFRFPPSMTENNMLKFIGKTVSIGIATWVMQNVIANLEKINAPF